MYTFYLDGMQLPVTPKKLSIRIKNQNQTVTLINDGEANLLKTPGLSGVSFEMLIPQVPYPFAVYANGFQGAEYYLDKLRILKEGKKSFQFICSRLSPGGRLLFDTNMTVSLEEYEIQEDASNGMDLVIPVQLKQYRPFGTKTVSISIPTPTAPPVVAVSEPRPVFTAPEVKTYTVVKGDCLWNIAKKLLGDGSRYREIFNLNKDKIKDPNLIFPGQVLTLP